jgi:hypothetical protein
MRRYLLIGWVLLISNVGFPQKMTEILGRPTNSSITINVLFDRQVDVYFEYGPTKGSYPSTTSVLTSSLGLPVEVQLTSLQQGTRYYYRTRYRTTGTSTYLASSEHTFVTQRSTGKAFTFTVEADCHPYDKKGSHGLWPIALQNQLNDTADFMIDLGDTFGDDHNPFTITSDQVKQLQLNCRDFFGKVCHSLPLFFCQGNHEGESGYYLLQTPPNNLATYETTWRKLFYPNPFPNGFYTGNSTEEGNGIGNPENYYAWQWGDALFIVLDAYRYYTVSAKPRNWEWTIGRTQYDWFKQTLANSTAKYKFVFTHHILGETRGGVAVANLCEWGDAANFEANRPGWGGVPIHQLMVNSKVSIFFQGHDHIYAKEELDNIVYQAVPMPDDSTYTIGMTDNGSAYTGVKLAGSGHLRVTVAADNVTVDYVGAVLPADETASLHNGDVIYSYSLTSTVNGIDNKTGQSESIQLDQNYPNPFYVETTISYKIEKANNVQLKIYDILGREITTLVNQFQQTGTYSIPINSKKLLFSGGIYFYRITVGNYSKTMKMICHY